MLNYVSVDSSPLASMYPATSPLGEVQAVIISEGMPRLVVTKITLRREGRNVSGKISLANAGTGDADNVRLKMVSLAGVAACSLASGVTLEAGQTMTVTLVFPNVLAGTQRLHLVGGCTIGSSSVPGSFISNQRVTVP